MVMLWVADIADKLRGNKSRETERDREKPSKESGERANEQMPKRSAPFSCYDSSTVSVGSNEEAVPLSRHIFPLSSCTPSQDRIVFNHTVPCLLNSNVLNWTGPDRTDADWTGLRYITPYR